LQRLACKAGRVPVPARIAMTGRAVNGMRKPTLAEGVSTGTWGRRSEDGGDNKPPEQRAPGWRRRGEVEGWGVSP